MSNPTFTPTETPVESWTFLYWNDTSAFFLSSYNYRLYANGTQVTATYEIINTTQLKFGPFGIFTGERLYSMQVIGTNGTFTYNKTSSQQLNVNCFVIDTEIKTSENKYIKIQDLKIGDEIETYGHGLKKIKFIKNEFYKNNNTYSQIHKISNYENQIKDLYVTGGHSILVDELTNNEKIETLKYWENLMTINDKYLLLSCVNEKAEKINNENFYNIFHIVLENNDVNIQYGIYANGILTETMSEYQYLLNNNKYYCV